MTIRLARIRVSFLRESAVQIAERSDDYPYVPPNPSHGVTTEGDLGRWRSGEGWVATLGSPTMLCHLSMGKWPDYGRPCTNPFVGTSTPALG